MRNMKEQLNRLEERIESLVEGALGRLLKAEIQPTKLASQLARAMIDGVQNGNDDKLLAPDRYALTFNPAAVNMLLEEIPDLRKDLAAGLLEIVRSSGYNLSREPHITIAADPTLSDHEVRVVAWHSETLIESTKGMSQDLGREQGDIPIGAYLIVSGTRHFPLDRPVINIGRRLDNHLILDEPQVSRTHAQLRLRESRFVLFDLGSTAGTRVNDRLAKQHVLQPGDVITIANTRLVYGEDPEGPPDETPSYHPPFPPRPAGDQPTSTTLKKDQLDQ
jgi:hypothetical protein